MNRRLLLVAGLSTMLLGTLAPTPGFARTEPPLGPLKVHKGAHVKRLPSQLRKNRTVMVAVQLEGRPLAVYQGAALASGKPLTRARKAQLRTSITRGQAVTRARIANLGGQVAFAYTDTFNGFRVRVKAGRLPAIARLPNVKAVLAVPRVERANARTVPYLGADQTWTQTGFTGRNVTIAIIDSGINYYHVDFGGAGQAAWEADDGLTRGNDFPTAKVIGGYDLVGDDYNAEDLNPDRNPDPDPLDCKDPKAELGQHGTHVAGTAAGFGVTKDGKRYPGPYTTPAVKAARLRIWPGVAPQAKLLAYRVFGCSGPTDVLTDAIEMAVRDGADVISMSLGGTFGGSNDLDALVSDNASLAGVTVVAAAGNEGPSAYVSGSPGSALRAISVGAMDAVRSFPGARVVLSSGSPVRAIDANGAPLPVSGRLVVFQDDPTTDGDLDTGAGFEDMGCDADAYAYNGFQAGRIAVVRRGGCARVDKVKIGQRQDAAAVIMVNNTTGLPPYEDRIPGVTIPFIGVSSGAGTRLDNADGTNATIQPAGAIANPGYGGPAEFTSAGPARTDSLLKPDVIAPGVTVFSAYGVGTTQGIAYGGTSMATPAIAGVAALVKQAHPTWLPRSIKAAIVGTASGSRVSPADPRFVGAGVPQARRAVDTRVLAYTTPGSSSLSFGYQPAAAQPGSSRSWSDTQAITIVNTGARPVTYDLASSFRTASRGVVVSIRPRRVAIPAGGQKTVTVTLSMSRAAAAALPSSAPQHQPFLKQDAFGQVYTAIVAPGGVIRLTPRTSGPGVGPLVVPWMVVPRGESTVQEIPASRTRWVRQGTLRKSSIKVHNYGPHTGIADVFTWGLQDRRDTNTEIDLRAGGVQSLPARYCDGAAPASDRCLVFALNVWGRFQTASANEYDVVIDLDGDEKEDVIVSAFDLGILFDDGTQYGIPGVIAFDAVSGDALWLDYARVGTNGSTVLLPVLASAIGLERTAPAFAYWAEAYLGDGASADVMTTGAAASSELAWFNAWRPTLNSGTFKQLRSGSTATIGLTLDTSSYQPAARGQLGWMIVSLDDANGHTQADLVPVGPDPR